MKELSIEEKAKRYDEVSKEVKDFFEGKQKMYTDVTQTLEYLFPELKESEDDRIRKAILELVRQSSEILEKKNQEQMIAWLEKQGKNNIGISEATKQKLEDNLNEALEKETPESCNEFLEKQGEQKPADKVEPKFKAGDRVIGIVSGMQYYITEVCDDCYYTESGCTIMFYAQDNFELSKQNPAWSEEDEKMYNAILRDVRNGEPLDKLQYDWLKSLRPQINVTDEELAQAKKEAYNDALDKIEYHSGEPTFDDGWSAAIWYLKKRNAQPQNKWKPSKEMLEALYKAIPENVKEISEREMLLNELYKDLKKLRDE